MEKVSPHITLAEATKSQTAVRKGINNTPSATELQRMRIVAMRVFEPVREFIGQPLLVSSFFRCIELNKAIGGASTSQHALGEAIDIDGDPYGVSNKEIFDYIRKKLVFDQLIWEFGNDNEPDWVHVSYTTRYPNRKQVLRAHRNSEGKVYYTEIH